MTKTESTTGPTTRTLPVWTVPVRIAVLIGATVGGLVLIPVLSGAGEATDVATLAARVIGGVVVSGLAVALVVSLTRFVERRRLRDIGLSVPADGWRAFLTGMTAWLLPAALTFGALALVGFPLNVSAPADRFWGVLALLFLAVLLSEAIPEELVFRGYVTAVLAERLRGWWVVVVQTALFTLTVLVLRGGLDPLDLSLFVAMGIVLGYLRMVTGSVWTTIGFHVAFQTGSQLVLTHDVAEFGGPEQYAMLALGAVPFTVAAVLISILGPAKPALFARPRS